jgi:putative ABC transport system permease protein
VPDGETVRAKLFGTRDPVGSRIRLNKLSCEVIGLLEAKGQSTMGSDQDDLVGRRTISMCLT